MTTLTLTFKNTSNGAVNCSQITPDNLANLTKNQIASLALDVVKNSAQVSDFFDIALDESNSKSINHIVFKNTSHRLNRVGENFSFGSITIHGDVGDFLGANLQGGSIICKGNAGDRVGDKMRRGLILIEGNVGDYCASNMIAGTIGILGNAGKYMCFSMKRGTILILKQPFLHATIQDCGTHTLPFLKLLYKSFQSMDTQFSSLLQTRVRRFAGDLANQGKGEILVLQT